MHGRTIKILLEQGTPSGIRHAEVVNWTGQAVVCPRARMLELSAWADETERPGVYLLLGKDDQTGRDVVYVGEAENVRVRLQDHVKNKEFWREAILFTSKDFNLTKSHVKYLESRLVRQVGEVKRARLFNSNTPAEPALPRSDKHSMEEFIDNIGLLVGALGYRLLEHVEEGIKQTSLEKGDGAFYFSSGKASATGAPSDEGFVIHAESTAMSRLNDKCPSYITNLRAQLLEEGVLVVAGELLRFVKSYAFTSPSAAACIVAGGSRNGREGWKLKDGRSLKQVEEEESQPV
jgi:Domain of unknown function (DUF4357)